MTDSPLVRVLTGHWLMRIDHNPFLSDPTPYRAKCACWAPLAGHANCNGARDTWIAHVVALLTSETQAELNRQFAGSAGTTGTNGREYRVYNAGPGPVAPLAAADPGFPVLPAVAWPRGWPK